MDDPGKRGEATGRPWRMLAILSVAELLGMSVWFAASAVAPQLRVVWGLTVSETAWLTTIVQLGFVTGTVAAALLNLADVIPSRRYFAVSALLADTANAALLGAGGYGEALALRFATGFFLAGVYPPGMKMAATWFRLNRGLAIGAVVGALTIGKAFPYLVDAIGGAGIGFVIWSTTVAAASAAALVAVGYRDGPHVFERKPFSWGLVGTVLRDREWRLATGGYLGHMWELYAFWTWIVAFLAASSAARAGVPWSGEYPTAVKLAAFAAIAVGGPACVWGGRVADRVGREKLAIGALSASGACALLSGLMFGSSFFLYYATWLVHAPIQTRSKALLEKYCEKLGVDFPTDPNGWTLEGQKNPYYCAMVEMLDAYVGKLLTYLETTDDPRWLGHKLIENTYVIFSSDNGGCEGGSKEIYTDNVPLDKGKASAKEGGIRVPLIITGPGIKEGVDSNVIANGLDFYPTILSWTKTKKPQSVELDGCDLSPMLTTDPIDPQRVKNASGEIRNRIVQHFPHGSSMQSSLRDGNYKLIYNYDHVGKNGDAKNVELELYKLYGAGDARMDIEEAKNLAASMPEKAQAMKRQLFAELSAMDASLPYLNPKTTLWLPNKEKVCTPIKAARDGNTVSVSFKENGAKVVKGYLMVTMNGGDQRYEEWARKEAVLNGDGTLSAELPEGTTHYLFNLIDENNFLVSYPELDDMSTARKKKKKFSAYAISVK